MYAEALPATKSIGGLSGWSSICRATYCPSKCAYHHPLLPPPCVSCCPAAEERTNGIRKYLWDDSTICCFNGVLGVFAAGKHNHPYSSLKILVCRLVAIYFINHRPIANWLFYQLCLIAINCFFLLLLIRGDYNYLPSSMMDFGALSFSSMIVLLRFLAFQAW